VSGRRQIKLLIYTIEVVAKETYRGKRSL